MSEFTIQPLLETTTVSVRDIACRGSCRVPSHEEATGGVHLVFPYRGVYVRHVGRDAAVADANQVLLFSPDEGYRVSHPHHGGDASLSLTVDDARLHELAPRTLLRAGRIAFTRQRLRIEPRVQADVAALRHRLAAGAEPLEAEARTVALVACALGDPRVITASPGRQRLVDRAKLVLAGDLSRRWTLAEVGAEVGASPVYLTQVFQQVEGVPLYRYQLRLRLARALDHIAGGGDLTTIALALGFSSHSHFSAAFQQAFGQTPSAFRRGAR